MSTPVPAPVPIPTFYRIYFATLDPLVALSVVLANLFAPTAILNSYDAAYVTSRVDIPSTVLLDTIAGFLTGTIFLQTVLLRARPRDLTV